MSQCGSNHIVDDFVKQSEQSSGFSSISNDTIPMSANNQSTIEEITVPDQPFHSTLLTPDQCTNIGMFVDDIFSNL